MKKLSMTVVFLLLVSSAIYAHNGAISLYLDETATQCSTTLLSGQADIMVLYIRGDGPYLGSGLEFRLLLSSPAAGSGVLFMDPTWSSQIVLTEGDIQTGISLVGSTCLGVNSDIVYIGTVPIFNIGGDSDTFNVRVVDDPNVTSPGPGIYILLCDAHKTKVPVLGGWFVFNGSCNPGVESKSWSAIKSMYR